MRLTLRARFAHANLIPSNLSHPRTRPLRNSLTKNVRSNSPHGEPLTHRSLLDDFKGAENKKRSTDHVEIKRNILTTYPSFSMMNSLSEKTLIVLAIAFLLSGLKFTFPAHSQSELSIEKLTALIDGGEENTQLYIQRGDLYFEKREFFDAVEDYTTAIELDPEADQAYFGRGMALARQGMIDEGIADLSVFIKRNPKSSLAYTKRGVRYIWKQDYANAEKDLTKALELDPDNSEAHDDLGVVYAKKQDYEKAVEHFSATIQLDPSYQKGYHNLAMTLFLVGQDERAHMRVNQALALNPNHRDALLLKSQILEELGRHEEAASIKEDAEFLPDTNWSESVPVQ
jgi:tetratricopeptide (TPR) repeat protein